MCGSNLFKPEFPDSKIRISLSNRYLLNVSIRRPLDTVTGVNTYISARLPQYYIPRYHDQHSHSQIVSS